MYSNLSIPIFPLSSSNILASNYYIHNTAVANTAKYLSIIAFTYAHKDPASWLLKLEICGL